MEECRKSQVVLKGEGHSFRMSRPEAEIRLQQLFGLAQFHDDQWEAIDNLLQGKRVLMIQRTGFGKSLVYQFTAAVLVGTAVVFSPLIALMRDQVQKLTALGIPAAYINSSLTESEKARTLTAAGNGAYKLLYIAPERQADEKWQAILKQISLSMVVVDEAHCISVWGHEFRPDYRRITEVIRRLQDDFPVLACTATATMRVQEDVALQLGNRKVEVLRGDLSRPNFQLRVVYCESQDAKMAGVLDFVRNTDGHGLIYCGTKLETEVYSNWLIYNGMNAVYYHSGLDNMTRRRIETGLMANEFKCVISTNALGMGLDKGDIRFVVHTQLPQSPLNYYQEIGRAGRDGNAAEVLLFYHPDDDGLPLSFINSGRPNRGQYERVIQILRQQPLGEFEISRAVNLKQSALRVILADLLDQGIIVKHQHGINKKYEFKFGAPQLDMDRFEILRAAKLKNLEAMKSYIHTEECRMAFLIRYLGDEQKILCGNCDRDLGWTIRSSTEAVDYEGLSNFWKTYFPTLDIQDDSGVVDIGYAASYYGISNVGRAIRHSKYEGGGDFPDFLLALFIKVFQKHFGLANFDLVLFVPPTKSGDLVKNFAIRVANLLKFPLSEALVKTRETKEQKVFETTYLKAQNCNGAFEITVDIKGKSILLIDDIFDSGHTIKAIVTLLKSKGARRIAPMVIAKTVGGR